MERKRQELLDSLRAIAEADIILDEKKKIIGKKVPIEKLEDFLTHYERFQKVQKAKG